MRVTTLTLTSMNRKKKKKTFTFAAQDYTELRESATGVVSLTTRAAVVCRRSARCPSRTLMYIFIVRQSAWVTWRAHNHLLCIQIVQHETPRAPWGVCILFVCVYISNAAFILKRRRCSFAARAKVINYENECTDFAGTLLNTLHELVILKYVFNI